jgi:T-complex protein 1 subunit delta
LCISALIAGGGAPEIHVSRLLSQYAQTLKGMEAYCFAAYAEALEVIPTTLAENAGLNPIAMVTELRNRHALGERSAGINVRKVSYFHALGVIQLAVSLMLFGYYSPNE